MITGKQLIEKMKRNRLNTKTSARRMSEFTANELNNQEEKKADALFLALEGILVIGKRDTTNPK